MILIGHPGFISVGEGRPSVVGMNYSAMRLAKGAGKSLPSRPRKEFRGDLIISNYRSISLTLQRIRKQSLQRVVVWRVFESEIADASEIGAKFAESLAEPLNSRLLLLSANLLIRLLIRRSFDALPREAAVYEVQ